MGASSNGLVAVGLGLLTGGLAFAAVGALGLATLAPIAAGLAFTVTTSLVMGGAKQESAASSASNRGPEELTINTATEARPIPVCFGWVKIGGNVIRYDKARFKAKPVYQEPEETGASTQGGKGFSGGGAAPPEGQKTLIGYDYRLSWDVGFCTGPIDEITGFYTQPGEKNLLSDNPEKDGTTNTTPVSFDASTTRVSRDITDGENFRGNVRFYSGAANQSRFSTDHYNETEENHRNVAFVHFRNFLMGRTPAPTSVMMELKRFPRVLDAAGDPIAGFPTRGSTDSGNLAYEHANPAACLFEILTNDLWGAAVSHDQIDVESFKTAAVYFAANHIGLSFVLSSQDRMSEAINLIRDHVQSVLIWNGEKLRMVCLMDRSTAYSNVVRITRDQVSDPSFTRPTWPSTVNEIRINFVNRRKMHRTQTVVVQDTGSIQAVGRIQSRQYDLLAFPTRGIANRQARRLLIEAAYPQASLRFKMNRLHAGLEAGAFVIFIWPDWTTGTAITFWRVSEILDDQTDSGELEVVLIEDPYAVSYETSGEEDDFEDPDQPYNDGTDITDGDVDQGDDHTVEVTEDFGPALIFEPSGVMTGGSRTALVAMQRRSGYIAYAQWTWAPTGGTASYLPPVAPWGIFGTIDNAIAITRHTARDLEIDVTLEWDDDITDILEAAIFLETTADHYSDLTAASQAILIINREIMRIGWAIDAGGGSVTLTGILRGCFGSEIAAHDAGDVCVFIPVLDTGYFWNPSAIPTATTIDFTGDQVTIRGSTVDDTQITFAGPEAGGQFIARSIKPPAPEEATPAVDAAGDWTITLRVRSFGIGAGTGSTLEEDLNAVLGAIPPGYAIYAVGHDISDDPVPGAAYTMQAEFATTPGDMPATLGISSFLFSATEGKLTIEATPTGAVDRIRLYTVQDTQISLEYLEVNP